MRHTIDYNLSCSEGHSRASKPLLLFVLVFFGICSPAQTYKTLYSFKGGNDGGNSFAGLIRDGAGNLYGTTTAGGAGGVGTVFRLNSSGAETGLYSFPRNGSNGATPDSGLAADAAGNGYGTTSGGGANRQGVIYKINLRGESVLYSFTGSPGGFFPGSLVRDPAGNLYGSTQYGGNSNNCNGGVGCGILFKLDTAGKFTLLHTFTGTGGDGANPSGAPIFDSSGNLYGVTQAGGLTGGSCGQSGCGTVYKIDTAGNESVLYSFTGAGGDGSIPSGSLLLIKGVLYGTTVHSSCGVGGSAYSLTVTGSESVLYCFTSSVNGTSPNGGLVTDSSGNLYGTMYEGGNFGGACPALGCGTVYELSFDSGSGKWVDKVLYSFTGAGGDGKNPLGPLVIDSKGNLYGTTTYGGSTSCNGGFGGCGVVFEVTP